jgi:hypothetical protein
MSALIKEYSKRQPNITNPVTAIVTGIIALAIRLSNILSAPHGLYFERILKQKSLADKGNSSTGQGFIDIELAIGSRLLSGSIAFFTQQPTFYIYKESASEPG